MAHRFFLPKANCGKLLKKTDGWMRAISDFLVKEKKDFNCWEAPGIFFLHIRWASRATWKRKRKKPMNPVRRGNSGPPTSLVNNATSQRPEIKTDNYHRTDGCTINTNLMMMRNDTFVWVFPPFYQRDCYQTGWVRQKRSNPLSCKATTREPINLD